MQKWLDLLEDITLENKYSERVLISQLELSNFESETGIILPSEYKNYCQVFGSGRFGDPIRIHYLRPSSVGLSKRLIDLVVKPQIKEYPSKDKLIDRKLLHWLDYILIFASDDRGNIAAWDLKSFNQTDNSYDIYWIQIEYFDDEIYKIGSDFYDFINDFCLGKKSFDFLPEDMRIEPCDNFVSYKVEHLNI
jgi:hypothetical protein